MGKAKVLFVGFEKYNDKTKEDMIETIKATDKVEVWYSFEVGPDYVVVGHKGIDQLDKENVKLYGSEIIKFEDLMKKLK